MCSTVATAPINQPIMLDARSTEQKVIGPYFHQDAVLECGASNTTIRVGPVFCIIRIIIYFVLYKAVLFSVGSTQ